MEKIKYDMYEVIEYYGLIKKFKLKGIMSKEKFEKEYKDRKILSIKNYDDTKTTSIIIEGE